LGKRIEQIREKKKKRRKEEERSPSLQQLRLRNDIQSPQED